MSTDTTGIQGFFGGLARHLIDTFDEQLPAFEIGDAVLYKGSHATSHGFYRVLGLDPARGAVTIGRHSSDGVLTVRPASLTPADDNGLLAPLPQYKVNTLVRYHGSKEDDHGYWMVQGTDSVTGMLTLGRGGKGRTLQCRPWSVTPAV